MPSPPTHMGSVALIRHTRAAVAPGICYGRTDVPPGDAEPDAARIVELVVHLRPRRIWTSPARRCQVLADRAAAVAGAELIADDRLLELDFGEWEGQCWDDIPRAALDVWTADPLGFAAPSGESGDALIARAGAFFEEMRGSDGPLAVISHAGPLRVLLALARGAPVDLLQPGPALGSCEIVSLPRVPRGR
ncbi:MAG TPA: histidine phosphatase family protein [Acetobacteraceae bacterium]|nr:histidine phosphatase family protein [Acetobacteraceae bacterium]